MQTVQTVTKLSKQFKLLRIFHLCVCWSGPVIDVWSLHLGCLWCLRFICRICTALSWKSQHQREDWANEQRRNAEVWVRHPAVTLSNCFLEHNLYHMNHIISYHIIHIYICVCIISISYPFVSLWRFPNPSQRFPFHSWSCHAMTDPISHEFSRARDMPFGTWRKNQETQTFPVGKETETTESGKSFKSRTPIFAVRMHDGGDATLAQLPPWDFW